MSAHRVLFDLFRAPFLMTDPGNAGTITVDRDRAVVPVVTAAAETRTLAQPTKAGLHCKVELDTDGGDMTLTVTGGYDENSTTTMVFDTAGDWASFESIKVGASYYWRLADSEGVGKSVSARNVTPGTGISTGTGTICEHRVVKVGGLYYTQILVDLTGLNSGDTDGDIIGKAGTANSHIGQITAAVHGTVFAGRMSCLETPAGGEPDIDLYSATEATGTEEAAVGDLTETALLNTGADWTAATAPKGLTANPAANQYLYLVASGGATNDIYTAGIMLIELWGK